MKRNTFLIFLLWFFIKINPTIGQIEVGYKIAHRGKLDGQRYISAKIYFDERLIIDTIVDVNEYVKTAHIKRTFIFNEYFPEGCKCWNIKFSMSSSAEKHILDIPMLPMRSRNQEKRIEIETRIAKNGYGFDEIRSNIAKKIYKLPKEIQYYRVWNPKIGNAPKYFIDNQKYYLLHGQAIDNSFEGILYRKNGNEWEKIYTGGYQHKKYPEKPLFREDFAISHIRNSRERSGLYRIDSIGEYKYQVYLGFDNYNQYESDYGRLPNISVNHKENYEKSKNRIQEFFEIEDYFIIE